MSSRPSYEQFISDIFLIQKGRYRYDRESYEAPGGSLSYTCPIHGRVTQGIKSHRKPGICNQCGQLIVGGRKTYIAIRKLKAKIKKKDWDNLTFDFSTFTKMREKMKITCKLHGDMWSKPSDILNRFEHCCEKCAKITNGKKRRTSSEEWRIKLKKLFPSDKVTLINTFVKDQRTWLSLECSLHGKFSVPGIGMTTKGRRTACPECSKLLGNPKTRLPNGVILSRIEKKFPGKFDFSKAKPTTIRAPITLICKEHQIEFKITYKALSKDSVKHGCPLCNPTKLRPFEFIEKELYSMTNNDYAFNVSSYKGIKEEIIARCKIHRKNFSATVSSLLKGANGCPLCRTNKGIISWPQKRLTEKIQALGIQTVTNDREILDGKEIDIFLPDYNLGIEYNGLIWHSTKYKDNKDAKWHMLEKQVAAADRDIELIHFDSSVPLSKMVDLVKFKCGKVRKIGARSTFVVTVKPKRAHGFLDRWHLQGAVKGCKYLGLRYKEELVGVMAMSVSNSERGNKDLSRWELRRMVFKYHIVGGASKLYKNFLRRYPNIKSVVSFSDNRWFTGGVYSALGFELIKVSPPDYGYTTGTTLKHKANFQKARLRKMEDFIFEEWMTETEACELNGFYKFFDCGKKKWEHQL